MGVFEMMDDPVFNEAFAFIKVHAFNISRIDERVHETASS